MEYKGKLYSVLSGQKVMSKRESTSEKSTSEKSTVEKSTGENSTYSTKEIEDHSDSTIDPEEIKSNPFLDPGVEEYYRKLYNDAKYECRFAFDPEFKWDEEEEKKVIWKLNWRVSLTSCIMFMALQIDRGNLAQAVTDNMLDELGLTTNDYNTGNTIFYVSFLLAEIPSQLISKALGPDIFIPIQICAWSLVAMFQFFLKDKAGFFVTRCLIGAIEGGFIADLVVWLSYFFTAKELSVRLSWFWTTLALTQIGTALLAFGILRMRGILGYSGWQWLFLLEGIFTLLIGLSSFYLMVPSAVQTRNWMHPKGWFTEREEKIVVNRVLRDDPSKGSMHNRQAVNFKMLWKSLMDYNLWPIYVVGLITYIGYFTFTPYFGLINRELGFSVFNTNLLTIPQAVLHIILILWITWFSERINERGFTCCLQPLYAIILMGVIRFWSGSGVEVWPSWTINSLYLGQPYIHAIAVSWVSRNSNSVRTRSISSALYNMFVQLGAIVGQNIYREDDRPLYRRGNMQLFCIAIGALFWLLFVKMFYVWKNKKRDEIWNKMTEEERNDYRMNTKDEGNKRLDFRFHH
ncbi:unnamed protein product [Candida verbasci]|uniref:Allantoate permease n=1 Tax=Candida verbasci TaxID=1227364 RepID=A0A9W4X9D4_9ASCO|nr:unnamed protein product [Candida verbasci]